MIDLSEHGGIFGGGEGSIVKKVQNISTVIKRGENNKNVSIEPVELKNTIIISNGFKAEENSVLTQSRHGNFAIDFDGNNKVYVVSVSDVTKDVYVSFSIVEFKRVATKQTGVARMTEKEVRRNINRVDLRKSLVFTTCRSVDSGDSRSISRVYSNLTNSTTLELKNDGYVDLLVNWQIIEFL